MISNDLIKYRDRNGNVKEVYSENNPPPLYEHNIHIEIDGLSTDSPKTYVNFTYIDKSQGKVFELDILIYRMGDGYRPATGVLGDLSTYCSVISVLANNGSGLLTIQAINSSTKKLLLSRLNVSSANDKLTITDYVRKIS